MYFNFYFCIFDYLFFVSSIWGDFGRVGGMVRGEKSCVSTHTYYHNLTLLLILQKWGQRNYNPEGARTQRHSTL